MGTLWGKIALYAACMLLQASSKFEDRNALGLVLLSGPDSARGVEAEAGRQIPLPAPQDVIGALQEIYQTHSHAVQSGDLHTAFRANIRFHQTLFRACGNPYLVEAINSFAFKSHGVRSYSLAKPDLLQNARDEHREMIEVLSTGNRERLIELCTDHLKPTVRAYTEAYEQIFGPTLQRSA